MRTTFEALGGAGLTTGAWNHPRSWVKAAGLFAVLLVAAGWQAAPAAAQTVPEAARAQRWDEVRSLLDEGADVDATTPDGATALHWASYWDELEIAELLIDAGADPNATNDLGATPTWPATVNASAPMVRLLLEAGADPNAALLSGESPVMTASRTGNPEVVGALLDAGASPNGSGTRGQTALMWAAAQGHDDVLALLLETGADVHARSDTWTELQAVSPHSEASNQVEVLQGGNTALMFAVRGGHLESVRVLVEGGADVNATSARGMSAVTFAAFSDHPPVVDYLLSKGADPNVGSAGFTALHAAILRRNADVVEALLDHGADPNAPLETHTGSRRTSRDYHFHPAFVGARPFWLAARFLQPDVMQLLVDHGADPHYVHDVVYVTDGRNYAEVEVREAATAVMAALGMVGSRRRWMGYERWDPAFEEFLVRDAVRLAVELGVDLDYADPEGRTALDAARSLGFDSVEEYLTEQGAT